MAKSSTLSEEFSEGKARLFQKANIQIFFISIAYFIICLIRSIIFYFPYDLRFEMARLYRFNPSDTRMIWNKLFFVPNFFSFMDPDLFVTQEYVHIICCCLLFIMIIGGYYLFEKNLLGIYQRNLNTEDILHVFTLKFSGIKNVVEVARIKEFCEMISYMNDPFYNTSCVFDCSEFKNEKYTKSLFGTQEQINLVNLSETNSNSDIQSTENYAQERRKNNMKFITLAPTLTEEVEIQQQLVFFNENQYNSIIVESLREKKMEASVKEILSKKFMGVMFITFKDIDLAREVYNLFNNINFQQETKNIIKMNERRNKFSPEQKSLIESLVSSEEGFSTELKVSIAKELNDLNWNVISNGKKTSYVLRFIVIGFLGIISTGVMIIIEYFCANEAYKAYVDENIGISFLGSYFTSLEIILRIIIIFVPDICLVVLEIVLKGQDFESYSSFNNWNFCSKTFFEVLLRHVSAYYGFFIFENSVKNQLNLDMKFSKFDSRIFRGNLNTFGLLVSTLLKYIIETIKVCQARRIAKTNQSHSNFYLSNVTSITIISSTFFYYGFFSLSLSLFSSMILTFNLLINWLFSLVMSKLQKPAKSIHSHEGTASIFYSSFLMVSCGGVMVLYFDNYYTPVYYFSSRTSVVFPLYFAFSVLMLFVFAFFFLFAITYEPIILRIINTLLKNSELRDIQGVPKKDYRSSNPFYSKLISIGVPPRNMII